MADTNSDHRRAAAESTDAAIVAALGRAGAGGLAPAVLHAEAGSEAGLAERTVRAGVTRLVAAGRVRRDGSRGRLFLVADAAGTALAVRDARALAAEAERSDRLMRADRARLAAELTAGAEYLDGRRVPLDLRGRAAYARQWLRDTARQVAAASDADRLAELRDEAVPTLLVIEQLSAEIDRRKDTEEQQKAQRRQYIAAEKARIQQKVAEVRRMRKEIQTKLDTVDYWLGVARSRRGRVVDSETMTALLGWHVKGNHLISKGQSWDEEYTTTTLFRHHEVTRTRQITRYYSPFTENVFLDKRSGDTAQSIAAAITNSPSLNNVFWWSEIEPFIAACWNWLSNWLENCDGREQQLAAERARIVGSAAPAIGGVIRPAIGR